MKPQRIQRKRARGWRMPPNTVYVGKPTRWGNPWSVHDEAYQVLLRATPPGMRSVRKSQLIKQVVEQHRMWLERMRDEEPERFESLIAPLRGKNLACWCPLDQPCHADVLLELANEEDEG